MTPGLQQLVALVPPPPVPGAYAIPAARLAAEASLGVTLPDDHRALLDTYGPGAFDDFLWLLAPGAEERHLDLVEQASVRLEALRSLAAGGEVVPYDVDGGELLPWAVTDNGDVCFWRCSPRHDPERWGVVVNEARGPAWEPFDLTATGFLVAVLSGRERVRAFPSDVPSAQPRFTVRAAGGAG